MIVARSSGRTACAAQASNASGRSFSVLAPRSLQLSQGACAVEYRLQAVVSSKDQMFETTIIQNRLARAGRAFCCEMNIARGPESGEDVFNLIDGLRCVGWNVDSAETQERQGRAIDHSGRFSDSKRDAIARFIESPSAAAKPSATFFTRARQTLRPAC